MTFAPNQTGIKALIDSQKGLLKKLRSISNAKHFEQLIACLQVSVRVLKKRAKVTDLRHSNNNLVYAEWIIQKAAKQGRH